MLETMRKILCIVFAFLICLVATYVQAEDMNTTNTNQGGTDLQTKQKELQDQINQANDELNQTQSQLSENLQQVQKLDEKIAGSETELSDLTEKIENLKTSMNKVQQELTEVTERYERQRQIFEQRMVAIYEAGDTNYLDILLRSRSVSDFLSSYYVISEIADSDTELLNDIAEKKDQISLAKQKLDNEKTELAQMIETQSRTAKILQNTKVIRENYIAKLSEEEKAKQAQIDEYNQALAQINSQILQLAQAGIDTQYIGGELAWPTPGYTRISSPYGMRVHPITGVYKLHTGVDIGAPMGANFVAANEGIVVKSEYNVAYGKMVLIDHGGGISTLYAHGSEFLVQVGDSVARRQAVLKVGSTGYSTGAHAHFEVRKNGSPVNPMPYITNGIVPNSEQDAQGNTTATKEETQNTTD